MKVGIITHYYNSLNYGGNLQAYALCMFLNNHGYDAEQIAFDKSSIKSINPRNIKGNLFRIYVSAINAKKKILHPKITKALRIRETSILSFNQNVIPHSPIVYNEPSLEKAADIYDAYITGSDQVWHPSAYCRAYRLDFVPSSKIKLSYAASIAKDYLTEEQLAIFKESLADYTAISVREQSAINILKPITKLPIELTLDPTLLLNREDWDRLATPRIVSQPYLFCYFLGNDIAARNLAKEYAKRHNLKVVTLPYLTGTFRKCDKKFGDEQLFKISPADFISLIKYADCVFTDSFHATIFSGIYQREYVVFERAAATSMSSRIYSLTWLLETQERFCDIEKKLTVSYIESLPPIDYSRKLERFDRIKEASVKFLLDNLSKAENN
ncbi:MAG: polysaccharide pyruvyl transferase family protein [Acutalibacteraceae bacterium]|jgi:hypothetical protein